MFWICEICVCVSWQNVFLETPCVVGTSTEVILRIVQMFICHLSVYARICVTAIASQPCKIQAPNLTGVQDAMKGWVWRWAWSEHEGLNLRGRKQEMGYWLSNYTTDPLQLTVTSSNHYTIHSCFHLVCLSVCRWTHFCHQDSVKTMYDAVRKQVCTNVQNEGTVWWDYSHNSVALQSAHGSKWDMLMGIVSSTRYLFVLFVFPVYCF